MKRRTKIVLGTVGGLLGLLLALGGVIYVTQMRLSPDPARLEVGVPAPVPQLVDPDGQPWALPSDGLSVLVFYRGHW